MRLFPVRLCISVLLALQLLGCSTMQPRPVADHDTRLNGTWQGTIAIDNAPDEALQFRLGITDDTASVWISDMGQWREAKPGTFHLKSHKSNAVIFSNDSGTDEEGTWVESWVFVVTLRSNDELLVEWSRLVNNLDLPASARNSKFAVHGAGTIQRVPRD